MIGWMRSGVTATERIPFALSLAVASDFFAGRALFDS
jgi:hypothetical protein